MNSKNKQTLFIISQVLIYVFALIYAFFAAFFFSLRNPIYWLFVVLGCIALFDGLFLSTVKNKELNKVVKYLTLGLSIVSPISFVLNLLLNIKFQDINYEIKEKEEVVKEKKRVPFYKRPTLFLACGALLMIFVSSFSAHAFATSGFKVDTSDFVINAEVANDLLAKPINGKTQVIESNKSSWSVSMYKPKGIKEGEVRPTVFIMPGFTRTKATMAQYAVEYSKRGAVCFIIDPGCQGATTYAGYKEDGSMISSTVAANGLEYLVHYVYNNTDRFPFVDRNRIGAIGHSAGGGNVVTLASDYAGNNYETSIVKALYISGYIKNSAANKYKSLRCNAVNAYAYYDEGEYRYTTASTALEVINMRFVNEVHNGTKLVSFVDDLNNLKYDTPYGDMADGTYRMLHREKTNHAFQMYDAKSITNTISFFRETLSFDTKLKDSSHTWFGKEAFNGLALISAFTLVISLLAFLATLPIVGFKASNGEVIETPKEENKEEQKEIKSMIPKVGSFASKAIFYGTTVLSAIIACLDFIPLARWSMDLYPDAAVNKYTFNFPARMMNSVMLWAVVNGLIGLALYFLPTLIENLLELIVSKKQNREAHYDWSKFKILKVNWLELIKTLVYAVLFFFIFYGLVTLSYSLFHEDFRFMLISAAPIQPRYVRTWLLYFPLFFIFYISNAIRVNGGIAKEGLKEWQVYLVAMIANSIGLVFMLIVNYSNFFVNGEVFYGYWGKPQGEVWLYINMVFALIPLMMVLPILNRFIYKKTGNVYLGALLICALFIMMSLTASVSYIPM